MDVSYLMTKEVVSAKLETPISDIAKIMANKRIHAVPVVDENSKVLGIITESDFFTKDIAHLVHLPTFVDFLKEGKIKDGTEEDSKKALINATAKDIMTSPCKILPQNANAEEFIRIVKNTGFVSIPVVNNTTENRLVGIVTVADIMELM